MAFSSRPGRPQIGAVGAPAGVAGMMALREPAAAPAAGIALFPDDARSTWLTETIAATAATAAGSARIPNLMMAPAAWPASRCRVADRLIVEG